jgi:hypothetical protein
VPHPRCPHLLAQNLDTTESKVLELATTLNLAPAEAAQFASKHPLLLASNTQTLASKVAALAGLLAISRPQACKLVVRGLPCCAALPAFVPMRAQLRRWLLC